MADKRTTWLSIALAAIVITSIACVALVGGAAYWFYHQHFETRLVPGERAAQEFERERARFAGTRALVEINLGREPIVHRSDPAQPKSAGVQTLGALATSLLRASSCGQHSTLAPTFLSRGRIDLPAGPSLNSDSAHFTVEDLERHGPGLILDLNDRDDDELDHDRYERRSSEIQMLVWVD